MSTLPNIAFILKGNINNGRNSRSCFFPALWTSFQDIPFINEEAMCCINEQVIGAVNEVAISAIIRPRNIPFSVFFFISYFTVSVAPSINRPECSSDFTILIMLSVFSVKLNKMNPFPVFTGPLPFFSFQI